MTTPKIVRNVYCVDPEDRVIAWSCPCCVRCWLFVASRKGRKNGMCKDGGPFGGFEPSPPAPHSDDRTNASPNATVA